MENYLQLVKKSRKGNAEAFAELYEMVYEDMYRFALYTLKHPQDAQDVVSDTVLDAFATIRKLRTDEAFQGWIFKILSNKCKQKLKEYVNRTAELEEDWEMPTDTDVAEHAVIRELFYELADEDRMIIALHMFCGYTSREMAVLLNMNENTLRSRESRAIKKLAERVVD